MSKKEIGMYYRSLKKGEHSLFLSLINIRINGCQDRWLRLFRAWSRGAIAEHDASEEEVMELNRLIRNESWREICSNIRCI